MSTDQIITIGLVVALIAIVVIQGISNYRRDAQQAAAMNQHLNLLQESVKVVTDTAKDLVNNPVWIENAKWAGQGVPQESFNALIDKFDKIEAAVGQGTIPGKVAQALEDVIRKIDRDPNNDVDPTPVLNQEQLQALADKVRASTPKQQS